MKTETNNCHWAACPCFYDFQNQKGQSEIPAAIWKRKNNPDMKHNRGPTLESVDTELLNWISSFLFGRLVEFFFFLFLFCIFSTIWPPALQLGSKNSIFMFKQKHRTLTHSTLRPRGPRARLSGLPTCSRRYCVSGAHSIITRFGKRHAQIIS